MFDGQEAQTLQYKQAHTKLYSLQSNMPLSKSKRRVRVANNKEVVCRGSSET